MDQPQLVGSEAGAHKGGPAGSRGQFQVGHVVGGRYKVIALCGQGAIAVVYRVEQIFLGKEFALKTLDTTRVSDVTVKRFQQEARAASALDHPNLIKVHDYGLLDDGTPFLVMDLIEGPTLSKLLEQRGRLPVEEIVPLFANISLGLAFAHEHGVVHRDIKPSNIMLMRPDGIVRGEGDVKVVDFGIAKLAQHEGGEIQALTRTGEIFGSPLYMSPEQCMGLAVDHRSDIYSLGCALYEALTGKPPLMGDTALTTMLKHQSDAPDSLESALPQGTPLPDELEQIVARMLAKTPDDRYQNIGLVAHDLVAIWQGDESTKLHAVSKVEVASRVLVMTVPQFYGVFAAILLVFFLAGFVLAGGPDRLPYAIGQLRKLVAERSVPAGNNDEVTLAPALAPSEEPRDKADPDQHDQAAVTNATEPKSNASVAQDPSAQADADKYPRSQVVTAGSGNLIRFEFPELIGYIRDVSQPEDKRILAKGTVLFPAHTSILIEVDGTVLRQKPDLLSKLDPGNIVILIMNNSDGTIIKPTIHHLKSLRHVDLKDLDVDDSIIDELNQLPVLDVLIISHTFVTAPAVARLNRLETLKFLDIAGVKKVREVLLKLKGAKQLGLLDLNNCDVTDDDLQLAGQIPQLHHIDLGRNPDITDAGLKHLIKLKHLSELVLTHSRVTPETARIISRIRSLKYLKLSLSKWGDNVKLLPKGIVLSNFDEERRGGKSNISNETLKRLIPEGVQF